MDLTLCSTTGVELDLGTSVHAAPDPACHTASWVVPLRAQYLRGILDEVLTDAGLVNYPTQWWHWSFGERYWALSRGLRCTRYAPVPRAL